MLKVNPKVTAATIGAAGAGYVLDLINNHLHVALPADIQVLIPTVIAAAVTFACGWLKSAGVADVQLPVAAPVTADVSVEPPKNPAAVTVEV